jgi:hypothetical protein
MNGAKCESEACEFTANVAGAVWMNSPGIFRKCYFTHNRGYCGGLYIDGGSESSLDLFFCNFEWNIGTFVASHLYFYSNSNFSASNCLFVHSVNSSIFLANVRGYRVTLSFNCFQGFGIHLSLPFRSDQVNFNVSHLCFQNSIFESISGFFPNPDSRNNIVYNCSICEARDSASVFELTSFFHSANSDYLQTPKATNGMDCPFSKVFWGVLSVLILVVVTVILLFCFFCYRRSHNPLSTEPGNQILDMKSMDLLNETELPLANNSIDDENSEEIFSSGFDLEAQVEESQV